MNELLAILSGIFLSSMISLNGLLSSYLSVFEVSFIVHFIGMVLLFIFIKVIKKQSVKMTGAPIVLYFVGLLGISLVSINSFCFGKIGATATISLSVFGQIAASALVDALALFGVKKVPFYKKRIISFAIICIGLIMITLS